jgi:dihydropteroate synthase
MNTTSKPTTFGQWNAKHVADLRCPAIVDAARKHQEMKKAIDARFAAIYDGSNIDAAAAQVAAELGCDLCLVERSGAFEDAYQGESAAEIKRMYL